MVSTLPSGPQRPSPLSISAPGAAQTASPAGQAYALVKAARTPRASSVLPDLEGLQKQMKASRKALIGDTKGRAREKIGQLREQLKLVKKLYAEDPRNMARRLAALAKDLQGAVKDYARAAKDSGEMFNQSLAAADEAALPPEARSAERKAVEGEAKVEISGDMDFIKEVRDFSKTLKELLQTARIKATLTVEGKFEQSEDYKDAEKGLKAVDEATEDLDQQIRTDMPPGSLMTLEA